MPLGLHPGRPGSRAPSRRRDRTTASLRFLVLPHVLLGATPARPAAPGPPPLAEVRHRPSLCLVALRWRGWLNETNDLLYEEDLPLLVSSAYTGPDFSVLVKRLKAILDKEPDVDVLITPEYLFAPGGRDTTISIHISPDHFEITGSDPPELLQCIRDIQGLAKEHRTNIILGGLLAQLTGIPVTKRTETNLQLIINAQGDICTLHVKIGPFPPQALRRSLTPPEWEFIFGSFRPIRLASNEGYLFTILPLICLDRETLDLIEYATGANVDILAVSQEYMDSRYDWVSEYIQTGRVDTSNRMHGGWRAEAGPGEGWYFLPYAEGRDLTGQSYLGRYPWTWRTGYQVLLPGNEGLLFKEIDELYQGFYVPRHVVKEDGYLLGSDIASPGGGIFSINKAKIERLDLHPSYVFGIVRLPREIEFVRGDANGDGTIDIADPIEILGYLFGGGVVGSTSACDSNDSGAVDIADPIYILSYLFSVGLPPAAPFPEPGPDPTPDAFSCIGG